MSCLTLATLDPHNPRPNVKVESSFLRSYTLDESDKFGLESYHKQPLYEVSRLPDKLNKPSMTIPMTVISFEGPRVGNIGFKERYAIGSFPCPPSTTGPTNGPNPNLAYNLWARQDSLIHAILVSVRGTSMSASSPTKDMIF
ncbi:hypothetical protein GH714_011407 [Hevea brasiliensis]|uniref:Uncharacterized protein n=1 Tax=Hevea brasiliensis TaxID=3981 RepID=A0A6A6LFR4_HEVBR|nr:hypothetical protein GH714_011407 [Hevea brasiliensis]